MGREWIACDCGRECTNKYHYKVDGDDGEAKEVGDAEGNNACPKHRVHRTKSIVFVFTDFF